MLVLSYRTLCLATGLFTNIQNMLELACCVKLHWSNGALKKPCPPLTAVNSRLVEVLGPTDGHEFQARLEKNEISSALKWLVPFLWCVFKTCLWFSNKVFVSVCVLGEFCDLPISYKSVQKKNCWFENSFLAAMTLNTFQVFRSAILDGMRAVRTHAQETWQPKPKRRLHHLLGRWPPMARSF